MDERSDAACLAAWRGGDAEAFEALVRCHQAPLLRHARALLDGTRRAPEDVVQEAFLRLAERPPRKGVDGEAGLAPWLHRVTRNLCMDAQRSETRRHRREREVAPPDRTAGGIPEVEAADTRAAVERGLARLPEDQREVLVLRLLGERTYAEIAAITGRKVGTIGWLVSVGLKRLAVELAPLAPLAGGAGAPVTGTEASGTSLRGEER